MKAEEVKATFDQIEKYLRGNTSILVRVNLINEMLKGISYNNYVEVGCGDGSIGLSMLDESKKLTLFDISDKMIDRAKEKTPSALAENVEYVVDDIHSYRFQNKFDLVICVGVLAHVPSIEELISKLGSMITDDGFLILQFTESHSLFGWFILKFMKQTYGGYEVNEVSYKDLKPLLENQNFKLVKKTIYSDSNMGLCNLSFKLAYNVKLFTSKLYLGFLFSEVILLLKRIKLVQ